MTPELLDTATRICELADAAAEASEAGERASTTAERDALRQVARDLATAAQIIANGLEAHERGGARKNRAPSSRLYALREAALHMRHLVEAQVIGPPEEGGAVARPLNLSEVPDAMLRNAAAWFERSAIKDYETYYLVGGACCRAYLAERIAQREEGNS